MYTLDGLILETFVEKWRRIEGLGVSYPMQQHYTIYCGVHIGCPIYVKFIVIHTYDSLLV